MIELGKKSNIQVDSEQAMGALGQALAQVLAPGDVVYLTGELGAGKTTLARAIIQALGYTGRIKSPSYGLIELYPINGLTVAHLDLYRLGHPQEVLDLGLEAHLGERAMMLIEWPSRGEGYLPKAQWTVDITQPGLSDPATADERLVSVCHLIS